MPEYLTRQEAFLKCKKEGKFLVVEEIDKEKIKATLKIAEGDLEAANLIKKNIPKGSNLWNSVYKLYYDAQGRNQEKGMIIVESVFSLKTKINLLKSSVLLEAIPGYLFLVLVHSQPLPTTS